MKSSIALCLLFILITCSLRSWAGDSRAGDSNVQNTNVSRSSETRTRPVPSRWGLDETEWARYEELMQGPRGYWSPGLDPLTVLGIHETNATKRRKYAELMARQEHDRVAGELAFDKAYTQAFERLYPNSVVIAEPMSLGSASRLIFFTSTNCKVCDRYATHLASWAEETPVDVFVTGNVTDDAIRAWATRIKIPASLVQTRRISLNHAGSLLAQLDLPDSGLRTVPFAVVETNGVHRFISMDQLP